MEILKIVKNRRTVRKYIDKTIPRKILEKIIEAGRWGPSPHNSQPWHFIVIEDMSLKEKLISSLYEISDKELFTGIKIIFNKTLKILESAPVIILVYNNHSLSRRMAALGDPYFTASYLSEIESIASSIQNMQLVASSMKIGSAWLTMPLLVKDKINNLIEIKNGYELTAILTLGYPAENGVRYKRKPISRTVKYI